MRFFVSCSYQRYREIVRWGEKSFALLPEWAQCAPEAKIAVVVGVREADAVTLSETVDLLEGEVLSLCFFGNNPREGYQNFFGHFLKDVVLSDEKLNPFFSVHIPKSSQVDELQMQDLVVDALFYHLAWYYICPSGLAKWNKERFDLCEAIASSLMFAYQPLGAPQ